MIVIKTPEQIEKMRVTCRLAAETLNMIEPYVVPGVTTLELNDRCHQYILDNGATPAPLNYRGFPKSICTSVNHQVCHGIPSDRKVRDGDILNVDITTIVDGWHGDTSRTFHVGKPSPKGQRIARIAKECLDLGMAEIKPGNHIGDIGAVIEAHARKSRCTVVQEYCGHGIGEKFHEEPAVLHYGRRGEGVEMRPGMIFTVEPMINLGKPHIKLLPDQWTVVTRDHSLSAQYEHTILVTETGYQVLTDVDDAYAVS
uniref:Methionine aminopeptidase n=1 Tax=Magnetococcus massalia (strain MO-1) TaxID=451514 RepID=A0A1S7LJG3_MAGMO|nr:Methionine aminopeptidase [Candidatus Magnetococcus massalia]